MFAQRPKVMSSNTSENGRKYPKELFEVNRMVLGVDDGVYFHPFFGGVEHWPSHAQGVGLLPKAVCA
jgi:hypothetical protein